MRTNDLHQRLAGHNVAFRTAPRTIREALPLGNGRFGALCYRPGPWEWCVNKLDVDLDEMKAYDRDDPALFMTRQGVAEEAPAWSKLLQAITAKDAAGIDILNRQSSRRWRSRSKTGKVDLDCRGWNQLNVLPAILRVFTSAALPTRFHQELDLYQGLITADCTEGRERYSMECAVDPDQDVFSIRFAVRHGRLPITRIVLNRPPHDYLRATRPKFGHTGDCLWVDYTFKNNFRYVVVVRITGAQVATDMHDDKICATLRRSSKELNLYVACLTCMDSTDRGWRWRMNALLVKRVW